MGDYDYEKMGNEIALGMMMKHRIREPTLSRVNSENFNNQEDFSPIPAWLRKSERHPGLPEHYHTLNTIENDLKQTADDDSMYLPDLPFEVNREILSKLIVLPRERPYSKQPKFLPPLIDLMNGTIIIVGPPISDDIKHNVEIFLKMHDKLLPCCYTQRSEIISSSPTTPLGRARCYYIPEISALPEICFLSSHEKVLQRNGYAVKWLPRSVPYHNLHY